MNERIRELLVEAREQTKEGKWHAPTAVWASKFAELIIAECADIAKHHVMNISTYADAEFVEKQIEEHFGVEE